MADNNGFSKLAPGFEFLQSLTKNAGSTMPNIGHWVAPTLNPEEIEKRIEELRTVKFWLEQNGRMLDTTIQALEVQRMTLSTLKTMNVHLGDLRDSMMIRKPPSAPAPAPTPGFFGSPTAAPADPSPTPSPVDVASQAMAAATSAATAFANAFQFPKPGAVPTAKVDTPAPPEPRASAPEPDPPEAADEPTPAAAPAKPATGVVDPMQWWSALTKQFAVLANSAVQDAGGVASTPSAKAPKAQAVAPNRATNTAPKAAPRTASKHVGATALQGSATRPAVTEVPAQPDRSRGAALPRKKRYERRWGARIEGYENR